MEPKRRSPPEAWLTKHGYPADDDQPVELYDLKNDVGQRRNLAAERPETVTELRGLLQQARESQRTSPGR
jgi:arylsulfatase A